MAKLMERRQPIEHVVAHDVLSVLGCVARHIRLEVCYKSRIAVRNLIEHEPYSHAWDPEGEIASLGPEADFGQGFRLRRYYRTGKLKEITEAHPTSARGA